MLLTLKKETDFARVAKFGRPFFIKEMGLKLLKNNLKQNRYGLIVSLKIDKRATVRNQVRRRLKAILDLNQKNFKTGFDLMILTNEAIKDLDYQQIQEKLLSLFKKAGILE